MIKTVARNRKKAIEEKPKERKASVLFVRGNGTKFWGGVEFAPDVVRLPEESSYATYNLIAPDVYLEETHPKAFPLGSEEIVIRGLPVWIRPSDIVAAGTLIATALYEKTGELPHVFTVVISEHHWKCDRGSAVTYLEKKIFEHLRAHLHS